MEKQTENNNFIAPLPLLTHGEHRKGVQKIKFGTECDSL